MYDEWEEERNVGEIQITHQFETRVKHQSQREMQQQGLPPQRSESMDVGRLFCYLGFLYEIMPWKRNPRLLPRVTHLPRPCKTGLFVTFNRDLHRECVGSRCRSKNLPSLFYVLPEPPTYSSWGIDRHRNYYTLVWFDTPCSKNIAMSEPVRRWC